MVGHNGAYVSLNPESLVDVVDPARRQIAVVSVDTNTVLTHSPNTGSAEMLNAWTHPEAVASDAWLYVAARSKRNSFGVVVKAARTSTLSGWISLLGPWLVGGFLCSAGVGWLALRQMAHRLSLRGSLERAIRHRELEVHYQPIVELSTQKCVGVEALVRWRQDGHSIGPDIFIPLAEEHGLIQPLTDLVLEKTLNDLAAHLRGHPSFYVTLNLSGVDLRTDRFLRLLSARLENGGVAPSQVRIEATERSFMDAEACRSTVDAFRRAGHSVYIDDFGTGYSSLSYLQDFKVEALKIDKSFVDAVGRDAASSPVALHIIGMAHDLGLNVVAEGIEHECQASYLAGHNVKYGQGWLFAKAMPVSDLLAYLQREGSGKECSPNVAARQASTSAASEREWTTSGCVAAGR